MKRSNLLREGGYAIPQSLRLLFTTNWEHEMTELNILLGVALTLALPVALTIAAIRGNI